MPGTLSVDHDPLFSATSISSTSIASGTASDGANSATTAAISLDGQDGCLVSVVIAYGVTVNEGAKVYILGDLDDGVTFESVASGAWGVEIAKAASTTLGRLLTVDARDTASFKVRVANNSGAAVTATVRTKLFRTASTP